MNLESVRRGSRNLLTKTPAVVTEESCPSFAVIPGQVESNRREKGNTLIFGVMNIHCGSASFSKSSLNSVRFLLLAKHSGFMVHESYDMSGLCLRTYYR